MVRSRFLIVALITALCIPIVAFAEECDTTRWYCTERLNTGLTNPTDTLDRATPRASLESLLYFGQREMWDQVAHLMDLSDLPPDQQRQHGAVLAEQLYTVIDRKTVLDWDNVVDRPDGLDAVGTSNDAMAGQPRKSLLLWTLDTETHPAAIRLNRVKPAGEEAVWVFSRQTVGNLPDLYARYGPTEFEKQIPQPLKQEAAFGLLWWELLGLPVILGVAALLGRLVWRSLRWLSRKADRPVSDAIIKAIRGPAAVSAATGFALFSVSQVFVFSGYINAILVPAAWLGVLVSAMWLVVNVVEVVLDYLTDVEQTDLTQRQEAHSRTIATRVAAARRLFLLAVALIGGGVFLSQTNLFQNLGFTLLGTAGALTLVLGFAARRVLGNIMASLQIALNQSAKIGDRIVYKDYLCHVERIHFTYVQLRDWDGTRLVVPVEEFVSTPFENWTMKELEMLRIIKLKFSHDADVEQLRDIFDEVISGLDKDELGDVKKAKVRVAGQDVFGKDVWFALPCRDPNTSWDVACLAREGIMAAVAEQARAKNVEFFPQANPAEAA